jgi:hypothetical protein
MSSVSKHFWGGINWTGLKCIKSQLIICPLWKLHVFLDVSKCQRSNVFMLFNHILNKLKYFIYNCKYTGLKPSLKVFIAKLENIFEIEQRVEKSNNCLPKHECKI